LPGSTVNIEVTVHSNGFPTVATMNEMQFDENVLSMDPKSCRLGWGLQKSLILSADGDNGWRVFVATGTNTDIIPDGVLYRCDFHIEARALPATVPSQHTRRV